MGWLPDASPASPVDEVSLAAPESMCRSCGRILLLDDNSDVRHYVERLLSETYEVRAVTDGEAAPAAARENP